MIARCKRCERHEIEENPEIAFSKNAVQLPTGRLNTPPMKPSSRTANRYLHVLLGIALLALMSGCSAKHLSDQTLARLNHSCSTKKSHSLIRWRERTDPNLRILSEVAARTPLLLAGQSHVFVLRRNPHPVVFVTSGGKKRSARPSSFGSAVPISRDGYFLTAAHCLGDNLPLEIAVVTNDLRVVKSPARVVWSGLPGGPDLAIIHAPMKSRSAPLAFADLDNMRRGNPVALTGWSSSPPTAMAAGRIVKVSPIRRDSSGVAWRSIRHDAPFARGDSGGPLIDGDGRLVAINVQMRYGPIAAARAITGIGDSPRHPLFGAASESFVPDPAWVQRTIAADRQANR